MTFRSQRLYELTVGLDGTSSAVVVTPPLRIAFSCTKTTTSSLNKMHLEVYNLTETHRRQLQRGEFDTSNARLPIALKVGYLEAIDLIFQGSVKEGVSERRGPDIVSVLDCIDGGGAALKAFTARTVLGKDLATNTLIDHLPNIKKGKVSKRKQTTRPRVLVGNTLDLIRATLDEDEDFFIDSEKVYIVKKREILNTVAAEVNSGTGLMSTPKKSTEKEPVRVNGEDSGKTKLVTKVNFDTLMNLNVRLGGLVDIQSLYAPGLNGLYKVTAITYQGDYDGSDWKQSVTCEAAAGYTLAVAT